MCEKRRVVSVATWNPGVPQKEGTAMTISATRFASLAAASVFMATMALAGPAAALEPSGHAVKVNPAVNATGPGGERLIRLEGAVFMGDEIVASSQGLAQIIFIDETRIVVGPNSRLKIDTFVFNPDNTAQEVTISAIKGTFRFISGNSPDGAYRIRTPTSTIGIRG
jgi:hypothetical protein